MAASYRKSHLGFIGFVIKFICIQCLKNKGLLCLCLFSFPAREAETPGFWWKSGSLAGWVFRERETVPVEFYPWGGLGTSLRGAPVPERRQPANSDIQRTPEAARTTLSYSGMWIQLLPLLHLVQISSFLPLKCMAAQLPNTSHFISFLKGFSGHQRPLGPAVWQARSAREWMLLSL